MKKLNEQMEKQETCLSRASDKSAKASDLIRSLVFAGFGLIWVTKVSQVKIHKRDLT